MHEEQGFRKTRLTNSRGNVVSELALVLPLLFGLIGGTIDWSMMFLTSHVMQNAAQEMARQAVVQRWSCLPFTQLGSCAGSLSGNQLTSHINREREVLNILESYVENVPSAESTLPNQPRVLNENLDVFFDGPMPIPTADPTGANMIRVRMAFQYNTFFLQIFGIGTIPINVESTMRYEWQNV